MVRRGDFTVSIIERVAWDVWIQSFNGIAQTTGKKRLIPSIALSAGFSRCDARPKKERVSERLKPILGSLFYRCLI